MACLTSGPRWDQITPALERLARMEESDDARRPYSDPPPPYTSGETTRQSSPAPSSDEERRVRETKNRRNSTVYWQFAHQQDQLEEQLLIAWRKGKFGPGPFDTVKRAREILKADWIEQGIYNNKWKSLRNARWKHEEPLQLESASEPDSEGQHSLFGVQPKQPRQSKNDKEKRRVAERRTKRELERQASRPNHQFRYQMNKVRKRIEEELMSGELTEIADIENKVYQTVKDLWVKWGIWWDGRWNILPGTSWKHEERSEQEAPFRFSSIPANEPDTANLQFDESTPAYEYPQPPMNDEEVEASSLSGPDATNDAGQRTNTSQQALRPHANPHTGSARQAFRSTSVPRLRSSNRIRLSKAKQAQLTASTALGPVRPSKVSKASTKGKSQLHKRSAGFHKAFQNSALPSPRRRTDNQEAGLATANAQLLPVETSLRRSVRISEQRERQNASTLDTAVLPTTFPINSLKGLPLSKPKRHTAGSGTAVNSAKPRGISKAPGKKSARKGAR